MNEIKVACGSRVTDEIKIQNEMIFDKFVGYTEGIQAVIQNNDSLALNAISFEKHCRNGIFNCGHFEVPLLLYYVSQELDFDSWFDVRIMSKTSSFQRNQNNWIQHACSLALLMNLT